MLIDQEKLGVINNTDLLKIINKANKLHNKGKTDKLKTVLSGLEDFLKDENSEECRMVVYIYSYLMEDYPELLTKKVKKYLDSIIKSENDETRLNGVILYGTHLLEKIEKDNASGEEIDNFIDLLKGEIPPIQTNLVFFIEQFPERYYDYFLPKLDLFFDVLDNTENAEVVDALIFIIGKVWDTTLDIKLSIFNRLLEKYYDYLDKMKREKILNFLASGFNELDKYLEDKRATVQDDTLKEFMEERGPLVKIYDIEEIAKKENMNYKEVLKNFEQMDGDENIFRFIYPAKKKYFVEIELKPLLTKLSSNKIKVDELIPIFGDDISLDSISLLNLLIKKLVKSKNIRGYLSRSYFYSYDYIKDMMMKDIQQKGFVDLDSHSRNINYDFILKIIDDINNETKFKGIFLKDRSKFYTLNTIISEIEKVCIKESMFDLSLYKEKYISNDYDLIEEECKKKFFTKFHDRSKWLTNIGYTRLTEKFREGQTIGYIDLEKIAEEQDLSLTVAKEIVQEWLETRPGIWDNSGKIYYFTKYIKEKLGKFDKSVSEEEKEKMVGELAEKLNLSPELIMEKLNQEIQQIIEQIRTKPEIDINVYCRALGFNKRQFIKFVDNLKIEYLVIGKKMIFDKRRIEKTRNAVIKELLFSVDRDKGFEIEYMASRTKFAANMIVDIIKDFIDNGKISGILLDNNEYFITERGIRDKIIQNKEYITMETLFPEKELNEREQNLVIKIMEKLIDSGELMGEYDEEQKEFRSDEMMDIKIYDEEKKTAEEMMKIYVRYMAETFDRVRDIYMNKKDIRPGDIKRKDYFIRRVREKWGGWERHLIKQIEKVESSYETLDDAGDLSFGEIFDAEEQQKAERIDGDYILGEFTKWKEVIQTIESKIDNVGNIKKRLLDDPENKELLKELQDYYEEFHFFDEEMMPTKKSTKKI